MFNTAAEAEAFITDMYPEWTVENGVVLLGAAPTKKSDSIPAMQLISESLTIAAELERIV